MTDQEKPHRTENPPAAELDKAADSSTFARCATCRHAKNVNIEHGTLLCKRFNMLVNAEADEIPDDCPEYERAKSKSSPDEPAKAHGDDKGARTEKPTP